MSRGCGAVSGGRLHAHARERERGRGVDMDDEREEVCVPRACAAGAALSHSTRVCASGANAAPASCSMVKKRLNPSS